MSVVGPQIIWIRMIGPTMVLQMMLLRNKSLWQCGLVMMRIGNNARHQWWNCWHRVLPTIRITCSWDIDNRARDDMATCNRYCWELCYKSWFPIICPQLQGVVARGLCNAINIVSNITFKLDICPQRTIVAMFHAWNHLNWFMGSNNMNLYANGAPMTHNHM